MHPLLITVLVLFIALCNAHVRPTGSHRRISASITITKTVWKTGGCNHNSHVSNEPSTPTNVFASPLSDAIRPFKEAVLDRTNYHRSRHHALPLSWNKALADEAGEWARKCVMRHPPEDPDAIPYGQNLFWITHNGGMSPGTPSEVATKGIDSWQSEESKYDYKRGTFSTETGHFTQLVWRNTTDVGCALFRCNGRGGIDSALVCNYLPPGNYAGAFQDSVREP